MKLMDGMIFRDISGIHCESCEEPWLGAHKPSEELNRTRHPFHTKDDTQKQSFCRREHVNWRVV